MILPPKKFPVFESFRPQCHQTRFNASDSQNLKKHWSYFYPFASHSFQRSKIFHRKWRLRPKIDLAELPPSPLRPFGAEIILHFQVSREGLNIDDVMISWSKCWNVTKELIGPWWWCRCSRVIANRSCEPGFDSQSRRTFLFQSSHPHLMSSLTRLKWGASQFQNKNLNWTFESILASESINTFKGLIFGSMI